VAPCKFNDFPANQLTKFRAISTVKAYDLTAVAPGSVWSSATPMIFGFFVHGWKSTA